MAANYVMPKLAMGMNEGTVVEWLVGEGEYIEQGKPLMNVETEKVVYDVEAPHSGWFHQMVPASTTVPVESLIGQFAGSQSEYAEIAGGKASQIAGAAGTFPETPAIEINGGLASTGVMTPGPAPAAAGGRINASPLARKLAKDKGIDLSGLRGNGPDGRIVERDVLEAEQALASAAAAPAPMVAAQAPAVTAPSSASGGLTVKATVPLKGMRGTIARRMVQSLQTAAQLSVLAEFEVTKLLAARQAFVAKEKQYGTKVSLNAFLVKAMAMACQAVPIANASIVNDEVVLWNEINVGLAIAIPGQSEWDSGLVVPVIRNVERKGLVKIDLEMRDLIARARVGQLKPGETEDGTITLSPTASLLSDEVYSWTTPVLNLPHALIVQPGQAMDRAVVRNGAIVVRKMMPISLTFDHRILDGEPFGRFYDVLHQCLENPELMLG